MAAGAPRPQSAWAFLKHLHGPLGHREMVLAKQGMTPYRPAVQDFLNLPAPPANRRAIVAAQETVRALPKAAALEEHYGKYTAAFDEMLEGKKSVQATCADLDRLMNAALAGT
jgi:hypothetical protein